MRKQRIFALIVFAGAFLFSGCSDDGGSDSNYLSALLNAPTQPDTIYVTGVTLNTASIATHIGATEQLTATIAPANAANKDITWASSNEGVATVSESGLVTGVADGSTTITVTTADGSFTASCEVNIYTYGIYTADDLNAVRGGVSGYDGWGLDKSYVLMADIDLSGVYSAGEGWVPIGTFTGTFTGTFNGNDYVIRNLTINRLSNYQGLFSSIGSGGRIENLGLVDVVVHAVDAVGGLAGSIVEGTVSNCYVTGTVTGNGNWVGGLAGCIDGTGGKVSGCYATVTVTGTGNNNVGGLLGYNNGTVSNSYVTVTVTGTGVDDVGGLVGSNNGEVSNSYATGTVTGAGYVGGLVGYNSGTEKVSNSYATGTVTGTGNYVGGLVGYNFNTGTVSKSYATGSVSGPNYAGGLVGSNYGTVSNSYATGTVGVTSNVGGLVGYNGGTVEYSYAAGAVSGISLLGGLVGFNGNTVSYSYYDMNTTLQSDAGKGEGKITADMQNVATYTTTDSWDFVGNPNNDAANEDIWDIDGSINSGYPYLSAIPPTP